MVSISSLLASLSVSGIVAAQNGDKAGEVQRAMPDEWKVDGAPLLDPVAAADALVVEPGLRVDLVASEPLLGDPVQIVFDSRGDLWVLEMRGYMPDADGSNERAPVGCVVRLRDVDGDGVMDEREPFLENLVLPRAIAPAFDGILLVEPPHLLFASDQDGDGRCDHTQVLASDFGGLENPEHAGNGLRYGIDNWYETSQHHQAFRLHRRADGRIEVETRDHPSHGQWGVARDDAGRLFYSPNSDPLIGDEFPKHYGGRNPGVGSFPSGPRRIVGDPETWPIRRNPGVNRGYRDGVLRQDGTLRRFTAACGPEIYRGTAIEGAYGDAFVCEPAGNLVKRFDLVEKDGVPIGSPVYEGREFLASTDERFRPVSIATGPDGGLYVADFARGVVQHRIYMTTWLRDQVDDRGLAGPLGRGRIWRIVDEGAPEGFSRFDLHRSTDDELVDIMVEDGNGWRRDTAQRILVERSAVEVEDRLRSIATNGESSIASRLHCMWTLDGIGLVDSAMIEHLVRDPDPVVREHAARISESMPPHLAGPVLEGLLSDSNDRVRLQAVLSLGELPSAEAFSGFETALRLEGRDARVRAAVRSGLADREIDFLRSRARPGRGWLSESGSLQRVFISEIVAGVIRRRHPRDATRILALAIELRDVRPGRASLLLDEVASAMKLDTTTPRSLLLEGEPVGWSRVLDSEAFESSDRRNIPPMVNRMDEHLVWPGRPNVEVHDLGLDPRRQVAQGRRLYTHCIACHQSNGRGLTPLYPPLDGSDYVVGDPRRLARILMHGIEGPIEVLGERYDQAMPAAPISRDADIAAVMTYIRQAWGNDATPVDPALVSSVRAAHPDRRRPWTATDLDSINETLPE